MFLLLRLLSGEDRTSEGMRKRRGYTHLMLRSPVAFEGAGDLSNNGVRHRLSPAEVGHIVCKLKQAYACRKRLCKHQALGRLSLELASLSVGCSRLSQSRKKRNHWTIIQHQRTTGAAAKTQNISSK